MKNDAANITHLTQIPEEVLLYILSFLEFSDFPSLNRVNKFFKSFSDDKSLWEPMAVTYFPMTVESVRSQVKNENDINYKNIFLVSIKNHIKFIEKNNLIKNNNFDKKMVISLFNSSKDGKISRLKKFTPRYYIEALQNPGLYDEFDYHPYAYAYLNKQEEFLKHIYQTALTSAVTKLSDREIFEQAIFCNKIKNIDDLNMLYPENLDFLGGKIDFNTISNKRKHSSAECILTAICITRNSKILEIILESLKDDKNKFLVLSNVLHVAIIFNSIEIIKFVIEINKVNSLLDEALRLAARYDHADLVEYLISKGSDENKLIDYVIREARGEKVIALFLKKHEKAQSVIDEYVISAIEAGRAAHKVNGNYGKICRDKGCYRFVEFILSKKIDINKVFKGELSALHIAIKFMDYELVKMLLLAGADITLKTRSSLGSRQNPLEYYKDIYKKEKIEHDKKYNSPMYKNFTEAKFASYDEVENLLQCAHHLKEALSATQDWINPDKTVEENLRKAKKLDAEYYDEYIKNIDKSSKDSKLNKLLEIHSKIFGMSEETKETTDSVNSNISFT